VWHCEALSWSCLNFEMSSHQCELLIRCLKPNSCSCHIDWNAVLRYVSELCFQAFQGPKRLLLLENAFQLNWGCRRRTWWVPVEVETWGQCKGYMQQMSSGKVVLKEHPSLILCIYIYFFAGVASYLKHSHY